MAHSAPLMRSPVLGHQPTHSPYCSKPVVSIGVPHNMRFAGLSRMKRPFASVRMTPTGSASSTALSSAWLSFSAASARARSTAAQVRSATSSTREISLGVQRRGLVEAATSAQSGLFSPSRRVAAIKAPRPRPSRLARSLSERPSISTASFITSVRSNAT